jgi:predicted ATPase
MALGHNSSRYSLAFALDFDVWFHCFRRDIRKAQKRAERLIELSVEDRFAYWLADGTLMQGWALAMQGKGEPAISQICEGMATYRAMGCGLGRPFQLALLSGAYVNVGQPDKGLHMLDEAQALVNKTGERWWEAELYRLKGKLLLALCAENQSEAEACFQQALDVARHQQAKSLELRAAMSLSRLWQNQGKIKEARQLLDKIYGWFTEGFDMADLKEAKALLQEIS